MRVTRSQIEVYCRRELLCDSVRFLNPVGRKIFLLIGYKRHTKQDSGQWYRNGVLHDFEYMEEHCFASGNSFTEVFESVMHYNRLLDREADGMTALDLLLEITSV